MTFLTLKTTDILHFHAVHFTGPDIVVELLVNAVEFVTLRTVIVEVHIGLPVTVDTPAHAQVGYLFYFIHGGNFAMTALALNIAGADML